MSERSRVITIDGPAASGKGTLARLLSADLGYYLLDSGLLYRIVALVTWQSGLNLNDPEEVAEFANSRMRFRVDSDTESSPEENLKTVSISKHVGQEDSVRIDDANVNLQLRSHEIGTQAATIAAIPELREVMIPIQRAQVRGKGLVADGRDMGTVIFPDADLKIYLDASVEERARRRALELESRGEKVNVDQIRVDLIERDRMDQERAVAPLRPAEDAVVIDATRLSIEDVFAKAKQHVNLIVDGGD